MRPDLMQKGIAPDISSIEKKSEQLGKSPLARDLDWRELQALSGYFEACRAEAGTVICRQGEPGDFLCLVCQGRVDVIKKDTGNMEKVIASLGPGNSIGEMSLIDGEPRSALVVAHTPVLMLVLTQEGFDLMAENLPRLWGKLAMRLARVLSKRLRLTSGVLAEYLDE